VAAAQRPHAARLDLQPYGRLGLVTFTVENAKGSLHEFATERFAEDMLAAQPGTEVPSSARRIPCCGVSVRRTWACRGPGAG